MYNGEKHNYVLCLYDNLSIVKLKKNSKNIDNLIIII